MKRKWRISEKTGLWEQEDGENGGSVGLNPKGQWIAWGPLPRHTPWNAPKKRDYIHDIDVRCSQSERGIGWKQLSVSGGHTVSTDVCLEVGLNVCAWLNWVAHAHVANILHFMIRHAVYDSEIGSHHVRQTGSTYRTTWGAIHNRRNRKSKRNITVMANKTTCSTIDDCYWSTMHPMTS